MDDSDGNDDGYEDNGRLPSTQKGGRKPSKDVWHHVIRERQINSHRLYSVDLLNTGIDPILLN